MKKNHFKILTLSTLTSIGLFFANCSKSTADDEITETTIDNVTTSTSVADAASSDVSSKSFDGATLITNPAAGRTVDSSTIGTYKITEDNGAIITITKTNGDYPITINRDFTKMKGTDADDNLKRGGIMTTVYTGKIRGANATRGATATTTFENYKIDSVLISGTAVLTNTSTIDTPSFTLEEKDFKITLATGEVLTRNGTLTTKMVAGSTTLVRTDDVFETTGELNVSSSTGATWTTTIASSNPVVRLGLCKGGRKINSGTITLSVTKGGTKVETTVNHGEKTVGRGTCTPLKPKVKCTLNGKGIDKDKATGKFDFNG